MQMRVEGDIIRNTIDVNYSTWLPDELWKHIICLVDDMYYSLPGLLFVSRFFNKTLEIECEWLLEDLRYEQEPKTIMRLLETRIETHNHKWLICYNCSLVSMVDESYNQSTCKLCRCISDEDEETTKMLEKLNKRIGIVGEDWFVCHQCKQLFTYLDDEPMKNLRCTEDGEKATFCCNCTLQCSGCGDNYCREMSSNHAMCLMHP
jgi:hypothetical protein